MAVPVEPRELDDDRESTSEDSDNSEDNDEGEEGATATDPMKRYIHYLQEMRSVVLDHDNTLQRMTVIQGISTELQGFEQNLVIKQNIEAALVILQTTVCSAGTESIREKSLKDLEDRMDTWIQIIASNEEPEVYGLLDNFKSELDDLHEESLTCPNPDEKSNFIKMHDIAKSLYQFLQIYYERED